MVPAALEDFAAGRPNIGAGDQWITGSNGNSLFAIQQQFRNIWRVIFEAVAGAK
jgi:hypothetical protein